MRRSDREQRRQEIIRLVTLWLNGHTTDPPAQWRTCGLPIRPADIRAWFVGDTTSRETFQRWYPGDPTRLDIDHIYRTWLAGKIHADIITPMDTIDTITL